MRKNQNSFSGYFLVLGILQSIVSVGAIIGGIGLCIDPTGKTDGVTLSLLRESPFQDYWYPGLFLLIVHGAGNLIAAMVSFKKNRNAGFIGATMGSILIIWVIVQIFWIGFNHMLQPAFFVFGFSELFLSILIIRDTKATR